MEQDTSYFSQMIIHTYPSFKFWKAMENAFQILKNSKHL
jgi:hypothetical protein